VIQHLKHGVNRARLGVLGAVDEATDARVGDGSGAHGAGLDGNVEFAIGQAVIAEDEPGFAQRLYLGVRRGVVVGYRTIAAASHNMAVLYDHRADGHLAECFGTPRLAQGFFHEEFVGVGH